MASIEDLNGEDPYEIMGLDRSASFNEIQARYRKLAAELHPDANLHDPRADQHFQRLLKAYDVLRNTDLRRQYDAAYGKHRQSAQQHRANTTAEPPTAPPQLIIRTEPKGAYRRRPPGKKPAVWPKLSALPAAAIGLLLLRFVFGGSCGAGPTSTANSQTGEALEEQLVGTWEMIEAGGRRVPANSRTVMELSENGNLIINTYVSRVHVVGWLGRWQPIDGGVEYDIHVAFSHEPSIRAGDAESGSKQITRLDKKILTWGDPDDASDEKWRRVQSTKSAEPAPNVVQQQPSYSWGADAAVDYNPANTTSDPRTPSHLDPNSRDKFNKGMENSTVRDYAEAMARERAEKARKPSADSDGRAPMELGFYQPRDEVIGTGPMDREIATALVGRWKLKSMDGKPLTENSGTLTLGADGSIASELVTNTAGTVAYSGTWRVQDSKLAYSATVTKSTNPEVQNGVAIKFAKSINFVDADILCTGPTDRRTTEVWERLR